MLSSHHRNNTLSDDIFLMIACLRIYFHSCSSLDLERRGMKGNNNDYVVKGARGNHRISMESKEMIQIIQSKSILMRSMDYYAYIRDNSIIIQVSTDKTAILSFDVFTR